MKRLKVKYGAAVLIFGILCVMVLYKFIGSTDMSSKKIIYDGKIIEDVYTDKGIYGKGESVNLIIELNNTTDTQIKGEVEINIWHLDKIIERKRLKDIRLQVEERIALNEMVVFPSVDFRGYLVEVLVKNQKKLLDVESTAVDISSDWTRFPRYGYLSTFDEGVINEIEENIDRLNKFHINGIQFYDWQHKHQEPLAKDENEKIKDQWIEIANRKIDRRVVENYIKSAHEKNIAAMNYNLLFGAWKDYEKSGIKKEWGMFKDRGAKVLDYHPLPSDWASDRIYLFDPKNPQWQKFIVDKEKEVQQIMDFDGWHIDQLGDRGYLYDYNGKLIKLENSYKSFFEYLEKEMGDSKIVFNAVNGLGQKEMIESGAGDFLYVEVWDSDSFHRLKDHIEYGQRLSNYDKNVVLAAYMNYKDAEGEFNPHSVKLTNAVIIGAGGSHIELGDSGMLSHEYFPNDKLKVGIELEKDMREYYDFAVAYENILRDKVKPKKVDVRIEDTKVSDKVKGGAVWYFGKEKEEKTIIHLINLLNSKGRNWRDDFGTQNEPTIVTSKKMKFYTDKKYKGAYIATPDYNNSRCTSLKLLSGSDENGSYYEVLLPRLEYWDMIVFE